jgi:hypothetical protein
MDAFIDRNGMRLSVGDRVRVSNCPYHGSDASRYRSQNYGEGVITSLNIFGAYVQVDGSPTNTWTTCGYNWRLKARDFTYLLKL